MPSVAPYHHNSDNESESGSEGHVEQTDGNNPGIPDNEVEEIGPNDFPRYFDEVDGRLFHSSPTSPYPLPVDAPEQQRLKAFNNLIHQLIGAHYLGPVPNILARDPNRQAQVLDLCTGTGTWLMEIASDFPSVLFTGIDIVPIATRYPRPNVNFEVWDITEEFRWRAATFDFVHARSISWSVRDYAAILPEVIRVMRPGGLYLSGELDNAVFFHPDTPQASNPGLHAPASTLFFQVVNAALQSRGIDPSVNQIVTHLQNTGAFSNIEQIIFPIPIGRWHDDPRRQELGTMLQAILWRFADSVKPMLRHAGHPQAYIDGLVQNFGDEMDTTHGLFGAYHVVQAIRS